MRPDDVLLAELQELAEADCQRLETLLASLEPQRQELEKLIEEHRTKTEALFAQMALTDDH